MKTSLLCLSKLVCFVSFLLMISYSVSVYSSGCDGVEVDCTVEELDAVHPEAIRYYIVWERSGYAVERWHLGRPENINLCEVAAQSFASTSVPFRNCEYVGDIFNDGRYIFRYQYCSRSDGTGDCQERYWTGGGTFAEERKECVGSYPHANLSDGVLTCHRKREDKHCPKTEGNPICIGSLAKKQRFNLYQGKGANALSYNIFYDSKVANDWIESSPAGSVTATATYLKRASSLSEDIRIDLPNNIRYHFHRYGDGWRAYNSAAGRIEGSNYITSGNKKYVFSALPITHKQKVTATSVVQPGGQQYSYIFNELLRTTQINNQFGKTLTLQYNLVGQLESLTDPAGQLTNLAYDDSDRLVRITYPDNNFIELLYENIDYPKYLSGLKDENGQRLSTYIYNSEGEAISTARTDGITTNISKDENNIVTVERFDNGTPLYTQVKQLEKINGRLQITQTKTKACDTCAEKIENFEFDSDGRLVAEVNENGVRNEYRYDGFGFITGKKLAVGTAEQIDESTAYNHTHKKPYLVTEHDGETYHTYNAQGLLTQRRSRGFIASDRSMRTNNYEYDTGNLLTKIDGPRVDVLDITSLTYDAHGNLSTVTNALGHVTHFKSYDAHGNALEIEDENGLVTTLTYNSRQWLLSLNSDGRLTSFIYDNVGNIKTLTVPSGVVVQYDYDLERRVTAITSQNGDKLEYTYDGSGNVTQSAVKDSLNQIRNLQTSTFNTLTLLEKTEGNSGQKVEWVYDESGNPVSRKDALNHTTVSQFDDFNRLKKIIDPRNGELVQAYDKQSRLKSVTDAEGNTTTYTYNFFDELIEVASPDTGTTTFTFDESGNIKTQTDARNVVSEYFYDALNRLIRINYPADITQNIEYYYDQPAVAYGIGRLTEVRDPSGTTRYSYDHRGNVVETRVNYQSGATMSPDIVTQYVYDVGDNAIATHYPSGRIVHKTLDQQQRVASVSTQTNGTVPEQDVASNIQYLPFGPASHIELDNGLSRNYVYDADYRLQTLTVNDITGTQTNSVMLLDYYYDGVNNITDIIDLANPANQQVFEYTYDELDRLTDFSSAAITTHYDYDAVGNRTTMLKIDVNGSEQIDYSYDNLSNRLLSILSSTSGVRTLNYDSNGNTTSDDRGNQNGFNFTYGVRNRLEHVTSEGAQ